MVMRWLLLFGWKPGLLIKHAPIFLSIPQIGDPVNRQVKLGYLLSETPEGERDVLLGELRPPPLGFPKVPDTDSLTNRYPIEYRRPRDDRVWEWGAH